MVDIWTDLDWSIPYPYTNLLCFLAIGLTLYKNVLILPNPNDKHTIIGAISEDTLPIFHNKMLTCHLQSPNMHIMFWSLLAKEKKDFKELTETLIWLQIHDTINILSSLNLKKTNTSIFSILSNRYLQKHENVKLYLWLKCNNLSLTSKLGSKLQVQKKLNMLIIKQQTLAVNVNNCNVITLV